MRLLPVLVLLLLAFSFVAACAKAPAQTQTEAERLREQSFIQDLIDENTQLRQENTQLSQVVLQNKLLLSSQNATIQEFLARLREGPRDLSSPAEHIPIGDVKVYGNEVIINASGLMPALVADTNSMDPFVDSSAKLLVMKPKDERDIHLGDIVGYTCDQCGGVVLHRVVALGRDADGPFYTLKGDNNPEPDPGKIRFDQIQTVLVGVIY